MMDHKHGAQPAAAVSGAEDVAAVMKKYDRESNTRIWEGRPKLIVRVLMALFSVGSIWVTLFSTAQLEIRLSVFLGYVLIMGFLNFPAKKGGAVKPNYMPWYDILIMVLGSGAFFFYALNMDKAIRMSLRLAEDPVFITVGIIGLVALIELCRRSVGLPILCVVGALLIYTFCKVKPNLVIYNLFYTSSGVMNTPIDVCAKFIVVFIIFGAFLERTGISKFFIQLANSVAGSAAGGPAKVAVISSALCGMVSGSSVGNTVTTGSVTIPMMKETGYKPEFAAAVEAAASTGGQIMPPIMGAAAFLMAEYMHMSYVKVALTAMLPALLYFAGIYIAVHLEARKLGLKGIPKDQLPRFRDLIKKAYLLLPLIALIALVVSNVRTMQFSAAVAVGVAILVGLINRDDRLTFTKFVDALEAGAKGTITVAVACAMAGIVAGCISSTGLASKLITGIVSVSGGRMIVALVLTMLCCIVLGMGVPTTANYCIMATTCAPILTDPAIGVSLMAAHFFVFYFGIVADITPPVALAAYAGSAIAKSDPIKTSINATKLAIAAFIVPYIFALDPSMLLVNVDSVFQVIVIAVTSFVGLFGVSAGLNGFLYQKIPMVLRCAMIFGGLAMMVPGTLSDVVGLAVIVACILFQRTSSMQKQKKSGVLEAE